MFGRRGQNNTTLQPSEPLTEEPKAEANNLAETSDKLNPITEDSTKESIVVDKTPKTEQEAEPSAPQESQDDKVNKLLNQSFDEEDEDSNNTTDDDTTSELKTTKETVYNLLMEQIDLQTISEFSKEELHAQLIDLIGEIVIEQKFAINHQEQQTLANQIIDDMLGLGPLEPLLKDEAITDIMVNGPFQIYIERKGKLLLSDIKFRDETHVLNIAQRIVTAIGRRVDESSPICDARLLDGSRVNVIAPPLSLKGCSISIRKFAKQKITLDIMEKQNNISPNLCKILKIAGASRLNIIISGGTGSGKTTLLNALSRMIDHGERVVTIEDAAELQLQQPHVVPLETRPANLEGKGEISMRDLVKNSLRMRPDRIILGEVRGGEAMDLLQAMNTGHDGSLGTLHANNPREALTRLENMINMGEANLPSHAIRHQISSAVDLIVQIQRMRDGMRRITHVSEVVGMEGDVIVTQDLFLYKFEGEDDDGNLIGDFVSTGLRPHFAPKASYFGLEEALLSAIG